MWPSAGRKEEDMAITQWVVDGIIYKKRSLVQTTDSFIEKEVGNKPFVINRVRHFDDGNKPGFYCSNDEHRGFFLFFAEAMGRVAPAYEYTITVLTTELVDPDAIGYRADKGLELIDGFYGVTEVVGPTNTEIEVDDDYFDE